MCVVSHQKMTTNSLQTIKNMWYYYLCKVERLQEYLKAKT